jgi:ATP-dependent DNA ligase
VCKKLESQWNYMRRTSDWVKLKPDYVSLQVGPIAVCLIEPVPFCV